MNGAAIRAIVRNDLRLFRNDGRALVVGILVPIMIAAFFGYVFGGTGNADTSRIPLIIVDEDQSTVSKDIADDLQRDALVTVQFLDRDQARLQVKAGKAQVAAIIPKNFANASAKALSTRQGKPTVTMLIDPSQSMSGKVVEGLFVQYGIEEITKSAFSTNTGENPQQRASSGGGTGLPNGVSRPYDVETTKVTSGVDVAYNGYAHSFAGMTVQFLLFAGIDSGVAMLLLRELGIWQRLRCAPISKADFLVAKTIAAMLIGIFQIVVIYAAAIAIFGVRIGGSYVGFGVIAVVICFMNATFGLMLASIGRSAPATRGIALMVTLLMVMIGGAWVPSFVFPKWLQQVSLIVPTRWAIDGLDAMTWRGLSLGSALAPIAVLGSVAAACLGIAIYRFKWDE